MKFVHLFYVLIGLLSFHSSFDLYAKESITPKDETYFRQMKTRRNPYEMRKFRHFRLSNGLEVFLVQDPKAKMAAASMNVGVGFLNDPPQYPGLAHYLEHVLFLGTKKYPDSDSYMKFMSQNGGLTNAFTDTERTNFHFEVNPSAFPEALDRFSEFFTHPQFNEDFVARELNNIDSEYKKNIENNAFRSFNLFNQLANPAHPQSRVFQGNLETLGHIPRQAVIDFYQKNYRASAMKLAIIVPGVPTSLDKVESLVKRQFKEIRNPVAPVLDLSPEVYLSKDLPRIIEFKPSGDVLSLHLVFSVPSPSDYLYSSPHALLHSYLNRKDSKSLYQSLLDQGLITGLSAYYSLDFDPSFFEVSFELSKSGYDRWEEVCQAFFGAVNQLKKEGLHTDFFKEKQELSELNYIFSTPTSGFHGAVSYATLMQYYDPSHLIESSQLYPRLSPKAFQEILQPISPEKVQILRMGPLSEKKALTSKFYETSYIQKHLTQAQVEKWNQAQAPKSIGYPDLNPYLPTKLNLIGKHQEAPQLLLDNNKHQIWIQTDHTFKKPITYLRFQVIAPYPKTDQFYFLKSAYYALLSISLSKTMPGLAEAGYSYHIYPIQEGFEISLSGYTDKIQNLAEEIISKLTQLQISEPEFKLYQEKLIRDIQNEKFEDAYRLAESRLNFFRTVDSYLPKNALPVVQKLTLKELQDFARSLYDKGYIRGFGFGNVNSSLLKSVLSAFYKHYPLKEIDPQLRPKEEGIGLLDGKAYSYWTQVSGKNHAWRLYYQAGTKMTPNLEAILKICDQLLSNPFYHSMRTERGLGYIVDGHAFIGLITGGLQFLIQSDRPLKEVTDLAENWIQGSIDLVKKTPPDMFEAVRKAALETTRKEEFSFQDRYQEFSLGLFEYQGDLKWRQKKTQALEEVTQEQVVQFLTQLLSPEKHRKLSIFVQGEDSPQEKFLRKDEIAVPALDGLKQSLPRIIRN